MNESYRGTLADMDASDEAIGDLMAEAVFDALRAHKAAGVPIVTWDWDADRMVIVPADEIVIPGDEPNGNGRSPSTD